MITKEMLENNLKLDPSEFMAISKDVREVHKMVLDSPRMTNFGAYVLLQILSGDYGVVCLTMAAMLHFGYKLGYEASQTETLEKMYKGE